MPQLNSNCLLERSTKMLTARTPHSDISEHWSRNVEHSHLEAENPFTLWRTFCYNHIEVMFLFHHSATNLWASNRDWSSRSWRSTLLSYCCLKSSKLIYNLITFSGKLNTLTECSQMLDASMNVSEHIVMVIMWLFIPSEFIRERRSLSKWSASLTHWTIDIDNHLNTK